MITPVVLVLAAAVLLLGFALFAALRRGDLTSVVETRVKAVESGLERVERTLREEFARGRSESGQAIRDLRQEVTTVVAGLKDASEQKIQVLTGTVEQRLAALQEDNASRLEQMRQTVDEKLQGTLEARLGQSFRSVSERLEQVHRGLGEMQALAAGVGDLKRVLTNVKARGIWGEVQLAALLEQVLAPAQFERNVLVSDETADRVEFAVRLPGRDDREMWLPIDSKFPLEDYQRLLDASEQGDPVSVELESRRLETRVKLCAREIADKYVRPPRTTEFAVLFLPTEGLFAEVSRRAGLIDSLQRDFRIVVAGPTTLWAILTSLQLGFRTLAIERRASEVWTLLGTVKSEFARFGSLLDGVQKKLHEASNRMDEVARKTRTIQRKLKDVQELPGRRSAPLLDLPLLETEDLDGVAVEET